MLLNNPAYAEDLKIIKDKIQQHSLRDKMTPDGDYQDLENLDNAYDTVGNASVVGLGEVTHGIGNVLSFKHRFIEYLVEKKDFTLVACEADAFAMSELNEYILGQRNQSELPTLLKNCCTKIVESQEFANLIKWMRDYNHTEPKHKIQISGFDAGLTHFRESMNTFKNYFDDNGKTLFDTLIARLEKAQTVYRKALSENGAENRKVELNKAHQDPSVRELTDTFTEFQLWLKDNSEHLKHELNERDYKLFDYNMKVLTHWYNTKHEHPLNARDQLMAENFLNTQTELQAKAIIWAHNGHVMKDSYDWTKDLEQCDGIKWMGQYLADKFGDQYRAIGVVAYEGTFAGTGVGEKIDKWRHNITLRTPPDNTFEAHIHSLNVPQAFIDLRANDNPEFLKTSMQSRTGQGTADMENNWAFSNYNLAKGFDAIVYVEKAVAAKPLSQPVLNNAHTFFRHNVSNTADEKSQPNPKNSM